MVWSLPNQMPMELSRLTNSSLVADTSAIINLNATRCSAEILAALPARLTVVDVAMGELDEGRKNGRPDAELFADLCKAGLVVVDRLGDIGKEMFEQLVIGPANETLDDGEAATIAYAVEHSFGVVVDDNKARRICRERYSHVKIQCSVELFKHPSIRQALGQQRFASAILNALRIGRMHVLPEHVSWVVGLIGEKNASACTSLPKRLRQVV